MKRTQILTVLAGIGLLFASTANAATSISLSASGTFMPGSVITLTTTVTADGGETDLGIVGNINFQDSFLNAAGATGGPGPIASVNTQVNLSSVGTAAPGWSNSAPGAGLICTTAFCTAFNQTNPLAVTAGVTNLAIASTSWVIDPTTPVGTVLTFNWRTTPSTQRLDWFGLTNGPGVSVTVVPIPEPTTVALLGLGLLGLAVAGRRRA